MSFALGLNSSTQSLSCVVIDVEQQVIAHRDSVNYGETLGDKYGIVNGFMDNGLGWVHAPPLMWVEAWDLLCQRLARQFGPLDRIAAIAGAGQQHGTVYLNATATGALQSLNPDRTLADQLGNIFSRDTSPIWRDTSTARDCQTQAEALGGRLAVAQLTGSVPTRRFSGPQIHKFSRTEPAAFAETQHIALVSSFMCSLLVGAMAPIDYGDGAGMNLMHIKQLDWLENAFGATEISESIVGKLPGSPVSAQTVTGRISPYYVQRYGFHPDCKILAFSGDNPDSLLGMGVYEPGQMVMSFGTSDTNFCMIPDARHDPDGLANVFGAVTGGYMALSCFANGALTRQTMRDRFQLNWEQFSAELANSPAANEGKFMIPFLSAEITPPTDGPLELYFRDLDHNDRAGCIRGIVEGQFLNMYYHSQWMGERPTVIRATGGASANREILQIGADVFGATIHQFELADSVSLGSALRAVRAIDPEAGWQDLTSTYCKTSGDPVLPVSHDAYDDLKDAFGNALREALSDP